VFLDEHIGKPKCEQADWPGAAPRRRHKIEGTEMPSWAAGAGLELPSVVRWQRKGTAATETRPPETALTKETERRPALEHCAHELLARNGLQFAWTPRTGRQERCTWTAATMNAKNRTETDQQQAKTGIENSANINQQQTK
jgi:hypothetical protein